MLEEGKSSSRHAFNRRRAQVYIATTKGLVKVQSITVLKSDELSSVATICSTSQLAGITSEYQAFVEKPQGIITRVFGGKAYRVNLSWDIDQGISWQLAVFLAHYLFDNDCLAVHHQGESQQDEQKSDLIFIATGCIDTLSFAILPIDSLAKKCLLATSQIAKWRSEGKQLCFLAPQQNLRKPLPDAAIKLTPIKSVSEISHICSEFNLPVSPLDLKSEGESQVVSEINKIQSDFDNEPVLIEADNIAPSLAEPINKAQKADKPYLIIASAMLAVVCSIFVIVSLNTSESEVEGNRIVSSQPVAFALIALLSENKSSCANAVPSLIDETRATKVGQVNAINLAHLCQLFLLSDKQITSLWLLSDTKAIIELSFDVLGDFAQKQLKQGSQLFTPRASTKLWEIPLPTNQSQTRRYTLLAFANPSDAADLSSLNSYMQRFHEQGKAHTISDIQTWISQTQKQNKVILLSHELMLGN